MLSSPVTDSVRVKIENDEKKCFVGMIQEYTAKTATTLKANATVAYFVHATLLKTTNEFRRLF